MTPLEMEGLSECLPDVAFTDDPYGCAEAADALIIVTEWE
jgi:hypothetical protein